MMDERLKRLLQDDMEREADHMMEELDRDSHLENLKVPEDIHANILAQINEHKAMCAKAEENANQPQQQGNASHLSWEEQELIRLGTIYKTRRKWNRLAILAAALVCILSLGLTATGGPDKLFEEVRWMLAGREQTNIDSDDDRVVEPDDVSEDEAYEKIEDEFNFYPVRMNYLPEGMEFSDVVIEKDMQSAQLMYEEPGKGVIAYIMRPNYRTSSMGTDVEDILVQEYDTEKKGVLLHIKQYRIEGTRKTRWIVEFENQDVQYILRITAVEEAEFKKIVENLYF